MGLMGDSGASVRDSAVILQSVAGPSQVVFVFTKVTRQITRETELISSHFSMSIERYTVISFTFSVL